MNDTRIALATWFTLQDWSGAYWGLYTVGSLAPADRKIAYSTFLNVTHCTSTTGINKLIGNSKQVTVYPNPANKSLTLTLSFGEGTKATVSIYDMLGKLVVQHPYSPPLEGQGEAIDVSELNAGVYFINIKTEQGTTIRKVIITK